MDENREDILNDLIKYYDNNMYEPDGKAQAPMGDTQVIGSKKPPKEETFGDTIAVKIKPKSQTQRSDEKVPQTTMHIPSKQKTSVDNTQKSNTVENKPEPVQEEVFGNLDIDGHRIERPSSQMSGETQTIPAINHIQQQPVQPQATPQSTTVEEPSGSDSAEDYDDADTEYEYSDEKNGLWYSLKPLWISLIISAILVGGFEFYMTDSGIIGTYKRNFTYNMLMILDKLGIDISKNTESDNTADTLPVIGEETLDTSAVTEESQGKSMAVADNTASEAANETPEDAPQQYESVKSNTVTVPFDEAGSSAFSIYDNGVVCAKSNSICFISSDGETEWEQKTSLPDPIVAVSGKYIALASKNGTQVCLFNGSKLLYTVDAENPIRSCDVSARGDIVLFTDKNSYKGAVEVINKRGEQIFSWSSGVNYITSVSMLDSRNVAVALANASGSVTSYIMIFDVHSTEPVTGVRLEGTLLFDTSNIGNTVYGTGDNSISMLKSNFSIGYDLRFDNADLTHSATDSAGARVVSYTVDDLPILSVYSKRGDELYSAAIEESPDFVDIHGKTILYNSGRTIICGKYTSDTRSSYTAPMSIKKLKLIDNNTYVVIYNDSLEFIRI